MIIKNLAIETNRLNKQAIILSLHPGTVDSPLSKPFQKGIAQDKIFSPEVAVIKLLRAIKKSSVNDTGSFIAWDEKKITP